ncbi:MAG: FecR family protein [Candidatus Edwardsbacteria bacterium]|jgi:hypothetical protein|nr:FecR family protein [Candidatus Edwardsbacteria bacterium]
MIRNILMVLLLLVSGAAAAVDSTATLTLFAGDCFVWHAGKSDEADIDQPLYTGDSVRTGKGSRVELGYADGTVIRLGENSRLVIRSQGSVRSVGLLSGKFWAKVAKLSGGSRFEVSSPTAVAGVRGTVFKVEVDRDSTSRVAVEEGEVEVHNPVRQGRMVRLAALQEAFVRRRLDPTEPRRFDPGREPRWERLTRQAFFGLAKASRGLLAGAGRIARDEDRLLQTAQRLASKADAGRATPAQLERGAADILRTAFDNRRKFRLLRLRSEKRFRQVKVLAFRVEEPGDAGTLAAEADGIRSEIDRITAQFETADARVMELLDRLDAAPQGGSGPSGAVLGQLQSLEGKTGAARDLLQAAAGKLDQAEPVMAAFLQEIGGIRLLAATQPLAAREQLADFRRRFAAFKLAAGGFSFPALDRQWQESRALSAQARRLASGVPRDDAGRAALEGPLQRIAAAATLAAAAWHRSQRLARQGLVVERLVLETDALLRR